MKNSIVIPCFNQGQFVDDAVDSVLEQSCQDFEIIIVNDGSTDEATNQLLQNYDKPKTRVISTVNQGLAAARNNGIREAAGEYILPLDADDRIGSTYIEQAVQSLDSIKELGIVYCRAQLFGAVETEWQLPEFSLEQMLLDNVIFCSAFFRRRDWEQVGGYDESLVHGWEDYDFWLSLLEMGRQVHRIPEILFYYRVSADSMVRARPRQHKLDSFVRLYHKHHSLFSDHIDAWIDKLLDVNETYHEAALCIQNKGPQCVKDEQIRKVGIGPCRLEFQISCDIESSDLLFKVADDYTVVRLIAIKIETPDRKLLITGWTGNADEEDNSLLVFANRNPEIYFTLPKDCESAGAAGKLVVHLEYLAFGRDCLPFLLEVLQRKKEKAAGASQLSSAQNIPTTAQVSNTWWGINKAFLGTSKQCIRYWFLNKQYRIIKKSRLFDVNYYLERDTHLNPLLINPLIHYLEIGWREQRNPNPLFEAIWYRQNYHLSADQEPLYHYIVEGWQSGKNPNLLFLSLYYAEKYPESVHGGRTPLSHYLHKGWLEGKNPNPCFDTAYYLKQNPEIIGLKQHPLYHYYHTGNPEYRSPMPFFDMHFYCEENPKAVTEWLFPLQHYYEYGADEGRSPNRFFDPAYYRSTYDLHSLSGLELFLHYVTVGSRRQYRPSAFFDPQFYIASYPEYEKTHAFPLSHYQEIGYCQGLYPCREVADLVRKPFISILTPVYNTDEQLLRRCIHSVLYQAYPHWELCLVDDGSTAAHIRPLLEEYAAQDKRIKIYFLDENQGISAATNEAADMATGEYLCFLDHDDELTLDALYEVARAVNQYDPDVLYSDENLVDEESRFLHSFFKPDFNEELLFCHNYITHFLVTRLELFYQVGRLSSRYNGAQDYDFVLKLTEHGCRVHHIPEILYHWRATRTSTSINHAQKDYADEAGLEAVQAAVARRKIPADVWRSKMNYYYEVHRRVTGAPLVDICTRLDNNSDETLSWLSRLLELTEYDNYCVYLIPGGSSGAGVEEELVRLSSRVKILKESAGSSPAEALNMGAQAGLGDFICFISPGVLPDNSTWLHSLLGYVQENKTGVVGGLVTGKEARQPDHFVPDLHDESDRAYYFFLTQASVHANGLFCPQQVLSVSSELSMLDRESFEKAGGLDTVAFPNALYDVDLCFQLRENGYHSIFTPYCTATRTCDSDSHHRFSTESPGEKEEFQRKWCHSLLTGNSFLNLQHILNREGLAEPEWHQWFAGVGDFTDLPHDVS